MLKSYDLAIAMRLVPLVMWRLWIWALDLELHAMAGNEPQCLCMETERVRPR